MHLVLILAGAVLAFAGALLVLYAVPVIDVAAAALFSSGMFAIVGALILFALAAVARGISRIAERLEVQPLSAPAIPPIATVAHEEPPPRPVRAEPPAPPPAPPVTPAVPAAPAERGPSVLSAWLKRQASRVPKPAPPADAPEPAETAPQRLADETRVPPATSDPIEATLAPLVAAAPPPAAAAPAPPPPAAPPHGPPSAPAAAPIPRAVSPAARPVPRAPASATPPEATVYKSGVIDGMAYTLFMDGSIEAELPQGRVRFASVDELQRYLTNRQ